VDACGSALFGGAQARRGDGDPARACGITVDTCVEAEALGFDSSFLVEHHFSDLGQVSASLDLLHGWPRARQRCGLVQRSSSCSLARSGAARRAGSDTRSDVRRRLEFGVGKGYRHSEFAGFCMPYEEAQARFEEALGSYQGLDIQRAVLAQRPFWSTKTSSSAFLLRKSRNPPV